MGLFRTQPRTLQADLRVVRKSATRTAFMVILLVSGVVPAVTFLFGGAGATAGASLNEQLSPLWGACLHTYPLTLAIAVITFSRKQKWFRFGKWFFAASVIVACASFSNGIAQWTGHSLIERANVLGDYSNPVFALLGNGVNYFFGFYETYGFAPFLASILVGTFAGSQASRLSRHVPRDFHEAGGLVSELVASRKRVA